MRIAVLGAGVMGRNIARVFLHAGHDVALFSRTAGTLEDARTSLDAPILRTTEIVGEAVAGADLVLESVPERIEVKTALFKEVEAAAPVDAILGTNTSSLPLDRLAAALQRPANFLGLHWFNPAHLIPLVEVVPTSATDPDVVERSVELLTAAGKRPRVLNRSVPGYVANRLQYALIREALQLLQDGVADAETIDAVITDCLGPRWSVIGPLRSSDLAGIDTAVAVAEQLFPVLSSATEPHAVLRELQARGRLGVRTGVGFHDYPNPAAAIAERDRGLEAVLNRVEKLSDSGTHSPDNV
ncbi:MAG TPA: 3-hydroxyacyl-CoA dehydrogenase family protein [Solirubrobacter sp.]|nr:3-hydroxyacyl-CoA dehydrogenase family protein [Solirubrobacter sp.]